MKYTTYMSDITRCVRILDKMRNDERIGEIVLLNGAEVRDSRSTSYKLSRTHLND